MRSETVLIGIAVPLLAATVLGGAAPAVAGPALDDPGPLEAARYLSAEELTGPEWRVAPAATTDGLVVTYVVTSRFGSWEARGRTQVGRRIREIEALARLEEVSKSEVFLDAVADSVTAPLELAKELVERPVETVKGIPGGVGRWFKKTRFRVEETYHDVKERTSSSGGETQANTAEDGGLTAEEVKEEAQKQALDYLQVTSAERRWYADLGVDPYSDNETLREAITSVARVDGLTRFSMRFATLPSLPGQRELGKTMDLVWSTDPWELRARNRERILEAGLSEETARAFEDNPVLSLTQQTALLDLLDQLAGVAGRQHVIARAIDAESRGEARALVASTALLAELHRGGTTLAAFLPGSLLPVARTAGGELVAILPTEAIFWTERVAESAREFAAIYADQPAAARRLLLAGEASERFVQGAGGLGWLVEEGWQPEVAQ